MANIKIIKDPVTGKSYSRDLDITDSTFQPYTPEKTSEIGLMTSDMGGDYIQKGQESLDRMSGVNPALQMTPEETRGGDEGVAAYNARIATLKGEAPVKPVETKITPARVNYVNLDGQTSFLEGDAISPENMQTLLNQGFYSTDYSGSVPAWALTGDIAAGRAEAEARQATETAKADYDAAVNRLNTINPEADPTFQTITQNITNQWNLRIADMEKSNKSREASVKTLGVRLGSRWTGGAGGVFGSIITGEEQAGIQRIADLETQKQGAIAEARQAFISQKWTQYSKFVDIAEKNYDEQVSALKDLQETTAAANKELQKQVSQSSRDSAVISVMSQLKAQGITDETQLTDILLNALNYYEDGTSTGGNFTFEEINKILKELKTETKSENLGTDWAQWKAAIADPTSGVPADATLMEFLKIKKQAGAMVKQEEPGDGVNQTEVATTLYNVGIPTSVATSKGVLNKSYYDKEISAGFPPEIIDALWQSIIEGNDFDTIRQTIKDADGDPAILDIFIQTLQGKTETSGGGSGIDNPFE